MTPKEEPRRGLGRGLSALIGDEAAPTRGEVPPRAARTLPVAFLQARQIPAAQDISPKKRWPIWRPSVKEKGVLTPILVRPLGGGQL